VAEPAPTFTQREEIIDCERVMLPALHPDLVSMAHPDDAVCMHDEYGRAWETRRSAGRCAGRPTISRSNADRGERL